MPNMRQFLRQMRVGRFYTPVQVSNNGAEVGLRVEDEMLYLRVYEAEEMVFALRRAIEEAKQWMGAEIGYTVPVSVVEEALEALEKRGDPDEQVAAAADVLRKAIRWRGGAEKPPEFPENETRKW